MPAMAVDWAVDRQVSLVKDQLGLVVSDLHNIMTRLRSVVGSLKVLCWQMDATSRGHAVQKHSARATAGERDVAKQQRALGGKKDASQDSAILSRRRNIVMSLREKISPRRDIGRDRERQTRSDGSLQSNGVGRTACNRSPGRSGQQHPVVRSDVKTSFLRKQAATLRRTFHLSCRRRRRHRSIDKVAGQTNGTRKTCPEQREVRPEFDVLIAADDHRDSQTSPGCSRVVLSDTSSVGVNIPVATSNQPPSLLLPPGCMVIHQLEKATHRNGTIVRRGERLVESLVELTGAPRPRGNRANTLSFASNVSPSSPSDARSSRYTPSPLSVSRLSLTSPLSLTPRSSLSPAPSYCGIYEQEVDETLDRFSGGRPVSSDPDVTDTCAVHPAYHRHGARSGENGGACVPKNKMVDVARVNGARFRVNKNRASSGGTGYFWRSIIEP